MAIEPFDETVIVAENNSMMRGLLRTILEQPKRTVLLCADGLEAVEVASQTLATLVLLDLRMPRMGGIEACQLIRESEVEHGRSGGIGGRFGSGNRVDRLLHLLVRTDDESRWNVVQPSRVMHWSRWHGETLLS